MYTLRELVEITLRLIGKQRLLVPVPFTVAAIQARLFELMPSPPLTTGQVDLLRTDNVASGVLPGFRELGIEPKGVEQVVPTYIRTVARAGAALRPLLPQIHPSLTARIDTRHGG